MRILHPELVAEYYESIKDQYPDLTLSQCNDIVSAPFRQAKKGITSGVFPTIRLKFFGTFLAHPKRIEGILRTYTKMFKECRMTPFNYFKKKQMLEECLKRKQDEPTELE